MAGALWSTAALPSHIHGKPKRTVQIGSGTDSSKDCDSKKTLFALEQGRADVARRRRRWRSWQASLDPQRLVFIDETWIKTSMAPLRGWGPKGERVRGSAPHGHWRTLTFLGALRCDGFTAPCVFDGPINGDCFRAYVEQQLIPVLKPGDIVIMDNLGSHKSAALRRIIRGAGARLWYLPPYSPDLNPIEQAFAKIKHWMRIAQKRTLEDICVTSGTLSQLSSPANAATISATQVTLPLNRETL
jgi:transposase